VITLKLAVEFGERHNSMH